MVWDEDDHTTKVYEKEIEVKKLPRTGKQNQREFFGTLSKVFMMKITK